MFANGLPILASVPTAGNEGGVSLQAVVSGTRLPRARTARSNALDHRAAAALQEHVGELRALGEFSCALPQALRFARERVHRSLSRPSGLARVISTPRTCRRPATLAARSFSSSAWKKVACSRRPRKTPLLDAERAAISADLRLSTDRIDEAVYAVLSRLAVSGASATFSYSCRDTREFRETYASWLMLQAYRLQQGNETLAYPAMKTTLGEPKSAVPTDRESALVQRLVAPRRCRHRAGRTSVLGAAFPQTARGRAAETRREALEFTEFDGHVSGAGPALDPCSPINVYSVTELEKAAVCPFRFFLKRGLASDL